MYVLLKRGRAGATLAVAAAIAASVAPSAAADPAYPDEREVQQSEQRVATAAERIGEIEARLATATAELDSAAIRAAQAAEAYNGAIAWLDTARVEAEQARRRAEEAEATEAAARVAAGRFAAAQYQLGGDAGVASLFLGAGTARDLASRAAVLDQIAAGQRAAVDEARAAGIVAGLMRTEAVEAEAAAARAADEVAAAKQQADAGFAARRRAVAGIEAERATLTVELAELRRTSVALERARQGGLEQDRQRRAAARQEAEQRTRAEPAAVRAKSAPRAARSGAAAAIAYAEAQIGKPYEWAADGPASFDCSGLTMMAWRAADLSLPHYSVMQYERSTPVDLADTEPGDLVFFATDPDRHTSIYHVGLYVGRGQMIHAPYTGADVKVASIWRDNLFGAARP